MKRKLPKASPDLAKSVWQAQSRPSTRSVARALTASGYRAHWVTVARWRRNGWRTKTDADHPLDVARAQLEAIAPLATEDPIPAPAEESGEQVSDAALLRQESRKLSALSNQTWNATEPQLNKLVRRRTAELAVLVQARVECGEAAINALAKAEKLEQAPPLSGAARQP